jgi:type VI secretion system secreted protein Hcp
MLRKLVSTVAMVVVLGSASSADAALTAYLKLKGQRSGPVIGSVMQKGREGTIAVLGASHEVVSPRDAASGLASGKRMHKPLVITKEVDKSSPILYRMLTTNENISELSLQFYRPGVTGVEQQFYTVKLTNATIASIRFTQPDTLRPETRGLPETEEISFTYQKIEWTWTDGGITAMDDWQGHV